MKSKPYMTIAVFILIIVTSIMAFMRTYVAANRYVSPVRDCLCYKGFHVGFATCDNNVGNGWRVVHKFSLKRPLGCYSNDLFVFVSLRGKVSVMSGKYHSHSSDLICNDAIQLIRRQDRLVHSFGQ